MQQERVFGQPAFFRRLLIVTQINILRSGMEITLSIMSFSKVAWAGKFDRSFSSWLQYPCGASSLCKWSTSISRIVLCPWYSNKDVGSRENQTLSMQYWKQAVRVLQLFPWHRSYGDKACHQSGRWSGRLSEIISAATRMDDRKYWKTDHFLYLRMIEKLKVRLTMAPCHGQKCPS